MATPDDLIQRYSDPESDPDVNQLGAAQVAGTLLGGVGAQAINGLGQMQGQSTNVHPPELGEAGQRFIRAAAPGYYQYKAGPVGQAVKSVGDFYDRGVQQDADLVSKYLGTEAGGQVAALGAVAPMLIPGPGGKERVAEGAIERGPLNGLPNKVDIPGHGTIDVGPNPQIRQAADNYMREAGISKPPQQNYVPVDPHEATRIAAAYDEMPHAPNDPKVAASYRALIDETKAQYQHIKAAGLQPEFIPPGAPDPYAASPRLATEDINRNNHFWVFPTSSGFGTDAAALADHPMLADSGETIGGHPATNNDLFRVVHDYFGHAKEGLGFRANGEENAWRQHAQMYSDLARPAMTAETRGQNNWVNHGPHAAQNKGASGADTVYAPQKAGLLPDEFNTPGDHFDQAERLIRQNGGVTLNPTTGVVNPPTGYAVSTYEGNEHIMPRAPVADELRDYVHRNADLFQNDPGAHLGVWEDPPKSGQHYLDVSHVEDDLPTAINLARQHQQLGIFDLEHGTTIPTPTYGGSSGDLTPPATHATAAANNASGESVASQEAINRVAQEKAAGQGRYVLHQDDTVTPLTGVGAVDERAIPGDVIVQRGVGREPYTILDRGGLPEAHARGRLNAALSRGLLEQKFAEGGEVGTVLGGLGEMMAKYAPEAEHLAQHVADNGGVTYSPTSGALHTTGTVTADPASTVALDHPPGPDEIHDFMMQHQEPLTDESNPGGVLHITSDGKGNHFMRIGQHEPDVAGAVASDREDMGLPRTPEEIIEKYLGTKGKEPVVGSMQNEYERSFNARPSTQWTPGTQTVANPRRNAFPGIYNDPRQVVSDAEQKVAPEDPLMRQLFGVSRGDLSDLATSRQGNLLGDLPGATENPTGSEAARNVMTPQNEQRLIDVLGLSKSSSKLFPGMNGWYSMDPLYERFRQIYGDDEAPARYAHFNTLMSMASPGSPVDQEVARGSAAHWLANEGRFSDFEKYGGGKEGPAFGNRPQDMTDIPGHVYHMTAQARPMSDYVRTGQVQLNSAKVPVYMGASGVPETGFQTDLPTGDAHFARAVGLADTRGDRTLKGKPAVPGGSGSTSEMQAIGPWFRNRVAAPVGMEASPAQALMWGAYSPATGVKSEIGAPKLEILSTQIGKLAQRLGVSPETARDMVITGKAGAFRHGGGVAH